MDDGNKSALAGGDARVPPTRWSIERPFDFSDWMSRPVPRYAGIGVAADSGGVSRPSALERP